MARDRTLYRLETSDGALIADRVAVANTLGSRALGLMFRSQLDPGSGLVIKPCSSIHMFFMRFPIDVAFVDAEGLVVRAYHAIKPWRVSSVVRGAKAAIELEPGALAKAGVERGNRLRMVPAG